MYRSIDTALWTDPKIKAQPPAAKLLFLYFVTNPHAHMAGIYYLPLFVIEHETGLKRKEIEYGIDTLSRNSLVMWDRVSEVVWVVKMFDHQGKGEKNASCAASQLKSLHNSFLVKDFLQFYAERNIPYRYPIDTVSEKAISVPDPVSVSVPSSNSVFVKEGECEGKEKQIDQETAVVTAWNSTPGVAKVRGGRLDDDRRKHLRARLGENGWLSDAMEAIKKFPLRLFAESTDGWKPHFGWFIRPGTVNGILEGKYDWSKSDGKGKAKAFRTDPGMVHPADAENDFLKGGAQ